VASAFERGGRLAGPDIVTGIELSVMRSAQSGAGLRRVAEYVGIELPRVFRTGNLRLFTLLPAHSGTRPGLPAVSGTRAWNEDESDYSGVRSSAQYHPWQLSG